MKKIYLLLLILLATFCKKKHNEDVSRFGNIEWMNEFISIERAVFTNNKPFILHKTEFDLQNTQYKYISNCMISELNKSDSIILFKHDIYIVNNDLVIPYLIDFEKSDVELKEGNYVFNKRTDINYMKENFPESCMFSNVGMSKWSGVVQLSPIRLIAQDRQLFFLFKDGKLSKLYYQKVI